MASSTHAKKANTAGKANTTRGGKSAKARGPGKRAGLDASAILAVTQAVAEEAGVAAVTMRRIADELGVAPNALYSYFSDKAALLDALLDQVLAGIEVPEVPASRWRDGLSAIIRDTRRLLLAHAELIPLYLARPGRGANAKRLGNAMLEMLSAGGIEGRAAADALRVLLIYALGFAAHEAPRRSDPAGESRIAASEQAFRVAPELGRMHELAGELARHPDSTTFETGLRWILTGIAHDARVRKRAAW